MGLSRSGGPMALGGRRDCTGAFKGGPGGGGGEFGFLTSFHIIVISK